MEEEEKARDEIGRDEGDDKGREEDGEAPSREEAEKRPGQKGTVRVGSTCLCGCVGTW